MCAQVGLAARLVQSINRGYISCSCHQIGGHLDVIDMHDVPVINPSAGPYHWLCEPQEEHAWGLPAAHSAFNAVAKIRQREHNTLLEYE